MPLGSSFVQNDSAAAPQTWVRTKAGADAVVYTNDTKRAAGHREEVTFRTSEFKATDTSGNQVPMVKMTVQFERQLSTDPTPTRIQVVYSYSKTAQNAVTTIRTVLKDFNIFFGTGLQSSDAKVDDIAGFRAHIP